MGMLQNDWVEAIGGEFKKPYYAKLYQFVKENYPEESVLIDRVNQYIEKAYQCSMTEEEKLYLVLNVKRVNDLYER